MKVAAARAKVERALAARLNRPLYATYHSAKFRLTPEQLRFRIDVRAMIDEALSRSRRGNVLSRTVRGVFGGKVHADVPVASTYSKAAVAAFVARVKHRLDRPARNATLDFSTGVLKRVKARKGRTIDATALRDGVETGLALPTRSDPVPVRAASTKPKVSTRQLTDAYPTVIAINRGAFQLTLFKHLKRAKTYTIAVGRQGLETPAGQYTVSDKQVNPYWHVPNSSWAGSLAGQVIPPGPRDPLKARWIGIVGGAGIHGTDDVGSLGSNASHGCIRMAISDVIELYDRTPYGSKIFIH
jgi:lipoprotein-anchoring transpeptidase ErfK/SrfK